MSESAKKSEDSTNSLEKEINSIKDSFLEETAKVYGLTKSLKALGGVAKTAIDAFGDFEMVKTNLQVVTGSAEKAEQQFEELKELAAATPFEIEGLANASVSLQQVGVQAKDVSKTLRMLGDVAGGNNEKFNRIAQNYAQILSVGKASSMDMRQFASAGLPVMKMMEEMGIQGQATADQVTEMFRQMTEEGGAFFNGMALQSGTVQGRMSTMNDTVKEMWATFAETSGLSDLVKGLLDILSKGLQGVINFMNKLNQHPILKAIFQGVLATAVTTLVTLIGVNLVTALVHVITKLTAVAGLQAVINPAKFAIGLGVATGGVIAMTSAFSALDGEMEDTNEELNSFTKSHEELVAMSNERTPDTLKQELDEYKKHLAEAKRILAETTKEYEKMKDTSGMNDTQKAVSGANKTAMEDAQKEVEFAQDKVNLLEKQYDVTQKIKKEQEEILNIQKRQNEEYLDVIGNLESDYASIVLSKNDKIDKKIAYYESQIGKKKSITVDRGYSGTSQQETAMFSKEQQEMMQEIIDGLRAEKNKGGGTYIRPKDWLDYFSDIAGVDVTDVRYLKESQKNGKTQGEIAGEMFENFQKGQLELSKELGKALGKPLSEDQVKEIKTNQRDEIEQILNSLLSMDEFSINDNVVKKLIARYKELDGQLQTTEEEVKHFAFSLEKYFNERMKKIKDDYDKTGKLDKSDYAGTRIGQSAMSMASGTDAGAFLQGMSEGGVWGGIINTLVTALFNVVGGLEGMDLILSPITNMFQELAPTIKAILLPLAIIGKLFIMLGKGIQWLLNFLTFGAIDRLADDWDELAGESSVLTENTKNVNEHMGSLTDKLTELQDAIDKQEQYYLSERLRVGAENQYKVNDMILTPQGKFSTNPKDTIIATKDPKSLVSGSGEINIQINNTQASEVNVSARKEGKNILIDISKKIADDFATGANGWSTAVNYREIQNMGRSLS